MRFIFGGKVLNYERHVRFFQIFRKIVKSSLEDLNGTRVTTLVQEPKRKIGWMKNYFLCPLQRHVLYIVHNLDVSAFRGSIAHYGAPFFIANILGNYYH